MEGTSTSLKGMQIPIFFLWKVTPLWNSEKGLKMEATLLFLRILPQYIRNALAYIQCYHILFNNE